MFIKRNEVSGLEVFVLFNTYLRVLRANNRDQCTRLSLRVHKIYGYKFYEQAVYIPDQTILEPHNPTLHAFYEVYKRGSQIVKGWVGYLPK